MSLYQKNKTMSKTKNILFRADSSSKIGLGHIMRDLVLANQYAKKGHNVIFATQKLDGNINHKIIEAGYDVKNLKSNSKKKLVELVKKLNIDLLIIDHYKINYKKEKYIKENTGVKILSFDDTYEKHHCDILLNHNISADKKSYKNLVPKKCELRCGNKYTLIRDEFKQEKKKLYRKNSDVNNIFIAMGGADHSNINIDILKVLKKFNNIKVNLVTTNANKNIKKLIKYTKNKNWITLHINSTKIAKIMNNSDFAIVTPSVTLNEIYFMKIPFIAIKTAPNQEDMYKFIQKEKKLVLKRFNKRKLKMFTSNLLNSTNNIRLINFIDLTLKEKKMILLWRNHPKIKQSMYNNKNISLKNHLSFIDALKYKNDKLYFLVKKGSKYIGVIDFTNIAKDTSEFGLYSNIYLRGVGRLLLNTICEYGFNTLKLNKLIAEVFQKNKKAIHLYNKFNFKEVSKKIVNEKEVICMELSSENRYF